MSQQTLFASLLFLSWACASAQSQEILDKNEQTWLNELEKGNDSARREAAFALGKLGAQSALDPLLKRLQSDRDDWVREAAAFALGEIGRKGGQPKLVENLGQALARDKSPVVRRAAAISLGRIEPTTAVAQSSLEDAIKKDESPLVRQALVRSLGRFGNRALATLKLALSDGDARVVRDAAVSLEPMDFAALRPLLPDLAKLCKHDSADVRLAALGVLIKQVGPEDSKYVPDLAACLKDGDEEVRTYAALALSNIGGREAAQAVPQLRTALRQQENVDLRRQAAVAIANIGPAAREAIPDLIAALSDKDGELRGNAALALGGIGAEAQRAYEPLLKLVEDTNAKAEAREEAAFALSRLGQCNEAVTAVPRILKVLGDTKEPAKVRTRLAWALKVHFLDDLRKMDLAPTFCKVLAEDKTADNKMLRYDLAVTLGMVQKADVKAEVFPTLLEFLRDEDVQIFVGKKSVDGGKSVNESGKGDARILAVRTLDVIGPARLTDQPAIIAELRNLAANQKTDADVRKLSASLLKKLEK